MPVTRSTATPSAAKHVSKTVELFDIFFMESSFVIFEVAYVVRRLPAADDRKTVQV
jgi:hypothetical protein